jgi:hypothetical protein
MTDADEPARGDARFRPGPPRHIGADQTGFALLTEMLVLENERCFQRMQPPLFDLGADAFRLAGAFQTKCDEQGDSRSACRSVSWITGAMSKPCAASFCNSQSVSKPIENPVRDCSRAIAKAGRRSREEPDNACTLSLCSRNSDIVSQASDGICLISAPRRSIAASTISRPCRNSDLSLGKR